MAYKDIVVYLDPTSDTDDRLKLAIAMAHIHGARLIGVDACSQAAFEGQWRDRATGLQDQFEEAIRRDGIVGEFHAETDVHNGDFHPWAHCADLIIAPQPLFEARDLVAEAIPEDVLLTAGAPMLILPNKWAYGPIGKNVMIAWNASREATRAVHDAMPFLRAAETVTVFTFSSLKSSPQQELDRILGHLRRHGVSAQASNWRSDDDISPIEALFALPETGEADLIVAGAYGHSPMIEKWLGGASRELSETPALPVLMSH